MGAVVNAVRVNGRRCVEIITSVQVSAAFGHRASLSEEAESDLLFGDMKDTLQLYEWIYSRGSTTTWT